MPLAVIHMIEGRDEKKKAVLISAVTNAITSSLSVAPESVRVIIQEVPNTQWGIGGKTAKELGR
jgi:4-oxalocrotonate tautomerase